MARPLRIQYAGAVYHVMCRGNDRQEIFLDDEDRTTFLRILSRSFNIYSVKLHAYVLMPNHFHLLVETPLGNLAEFMRQFNITYTSYFNRQHKRVGHLYQGRYKSILVEKASYLGMASRYIHLNPIRSKSLEQVSATEKYESLIKYPWSSLPGYLGKDKQQVMVDYALVLADYGGQTKKGLDLYRKQLLADIEDGLDLKDEVFGQSILGSDRFIELINSEFLEAGPVREQPAARSLRQYQQQAVILAAIERETGQNLAALITGKGELRRVAMDLLYRFGGLKGPAIGALFGIDYSVVSQERKRLRERLGRDPELEGLMQRLERELSTTKI
ncbi:MAG: transposase [Desulfuromonadales bacterium]|nr:transposase [Desulfuromonadales bacterium]